MGVANFPSSIASIFFNFTLPTDDFQYHRAHRLEEKQPAYHPFFTFGYNRHHIFCKSKGDVK